MQNPDQWQTSVLRDWTHNWLICASRQSGKSTVIAAKSYLEAACDGHFVLIISRSEKQAFEFMEKVADCLRRCPVTPLSRHPSMSEIRFENGGRILALAHSDQTVVGYSAVDVLVLDEAARISDLVYRAVRPMLVTTKGRIICLSTPYGQRGFYYDLWKNGKDYAKVEAPWHQCPRITPEWVENERAENGDLYVRQEYECEFLPTAMECAFDIERMNELLVNVQSTGVL